MAGVAHGQRARVLERQSAFEVGDEVRHAVGAHGGQGGIEPARGERGDFVERAFAQHLVEPRRDAGAERLALGGEEQPGPGAGRQGGGGARAVKFGERPAGRRDNFERAQHALAVARPQPRGGGRIARRERSVQARRRLPLGLGAHRRAHGFGHARNVGQALGQGAEIEAGAADEDQRRARAGEDFARPRQPAADGEILGRVDFTEQQVRRAPRLGGARARGQDPEISVDLHCVGVDDRRAEPLGEFERDRRLAARRRAGDEQGAAHRSCRHASGERHMKPTRWPARVALKLKRAWPSLRATAKQSRLSDRRRPQVWIASLCSQ